MEGILFFTTSERLLYGVHIQLDSKDLKMKFTGQKSIDVFNAFAFGVAGNISVHSLNKREDSPM